MGPPSIVHKDPVHYALFHLRWPKYQSCLCNLWFQFWRQRLACCLEPLFMLCMSRLALFPGPTQLFVACCMVSFLTWAWHNWKMVKLSGCISHTVQLTTCSTLSVYDNRSLLARWEKIYSPKLEYAHVTCDILDTSKGYPTNEDKIFTTFCKGIKSNAFPGPSLTWLPYSDLCEQILYRH